MSVGLVLSLVHFLIILTVLLFVDLLLGAELEILHEEIAQSHGKVTFYIDSLVDYLERLIICMFNILKLLFNGINLIDIHTKNALKEET